jgi:acyl-CoA synthetase (AMP-forming)/AMP-acid ligase II
MHQAVLERARRDPALLDGHTLRFVRSSSAALPVPVFEGLAEVLGVPVIEAYGMTEAAHQMASNPLPPGESKGGSVGVAAGPEIAILDPDGHVLTAGDVGEVAIRGESVFAGYEANPQANADAFSDGTGTSSSWDASRRSSTGRARRSRPSRSTTRSCATPRSPRR